MTRRPFDLSRDLEPWAKVWRETPQGWGMMMLNLEIVDGELYEITRDEAWIKLTGKLDQ